MSIEVERQAELRLKLLALADLESPYLFLSVVGEYLAEVPDDDQIRATAMRLALQKRLFSVAEEYARGCPASSPAYDQIRGVAEQFAAHRTDLLDWNTTDACFARNLHALRQRGPDGIAQADEVERAWRNMPPNRTLHRAADGNSLVRASRQDGLRIWIPAAQDFLGAGEAIDENVNFRGEFVSPFLLDGVGIGCLVPRLHAATDCTYLHYSPAIYIIEPNVRALALALRLFDWSAALADDRVVLKAGPAAWDDWLALMHRDEELPEPGQVVSLTRWPGDRRPSADDYLQRLKHHRRAVYQQRRADADHLYTGRDAAWWVRRYEAATHGDGEPLRVLCMTCRHTTFLRHSMCDLETALRRAGLRTKFVMESRDHTSMPGAVMMRHFKTFAPDLVLVIDHHRCEMPERFIANVPYVCWIQDELPRLYSTAAGRSLGPLDFTIGFGRDACVSQFGYPPGRFMPCSLAVDPNKFAPTEGAATPDPQLRCDVVYIGHQAETPADLHARVRAQLEPPINSLVDAFYEEMLPRMQAPPFNGAHDLDRLLREVAQKAGIVLSDDGSRTRLLGAYVRPLADRVLRHATLEWVADWADATGHTLHLYGRNWEQHPRLGRFARGEARHGRHFGEIVRSAAINLHCGLNLALHQRVLETSIAGGFLLVRHHPQDFYPEWLTALWTWLRQRDIQPPVRLPYDDLPVELAEAHRRQLETRGQPVTGFADIPAHFLTRNDPARTDERRQRIAGEMFPSLRRITFDSPGSFAAQAAHFLARPEERVAIVCQMQAIVREEFTYDALV
ncbi:MAG: hypothetical protein HY718_07760, partial [Planctomycetes bacterium]|nr:hypothetical protein [Planctomycetota bacterium]